MSVIIMCDERWCSNKATLLCDACVEDKLEIAYNGGYNEGIAHCEGGHKT